MKEKNRSNRLLLVAWWFVTAMPIVILIAMLCGVEFPHPSLRNAVITGCVAVVIIIAVVVWGISGKDSDDVLAQKRLDLFMKQREERTNQIYLERLYSDKPSINPVHQKAELELTIPVDLQPELIEFAKHYVIPYAKVLTKLGLLDPIIRILKTLHAYGEQPSVGNPDAIIHLYRESSDGKETAKLLARISLTEHSINTARIMLETLKKESPNYRIEIGINLICGLGHDLGKIEALRGQIKQYKKSDHWIASKQILNEIIPDSCPTKDEILNAVANHHGQGDTALEKRLINADRAARSHELKKVAPLLDPDEGTPEKKIVDKGKVNPGGTNPSRHEIVDLSDIDIKRCLSIIGEKLNVFNGKRHEAILIKGIAYVHLSLISKTIGMLTSKGTIRKYCADPAKVRDVEFSFRRLIDEHIPNKIGKKYTGQRYQVILEDGEALNAAFFMPIKVSAFPGYIIEQAEERRRNNDFGSRIKKVEVVSS